MNISYSVWLTRMSIIVAWLGAIYLFLHAPQITKYFVKERSINILTWPTLLDSEFLVNFERKTGIKVFISYYDNNEEMLVKLRAGKGKGYDLVMPSDYAMEFLIQENLVKKIEYEKLNFVADINPLFRDLFYDPHNEYTLPFSWGVFGLGVDMAYFNNTIAPSWGLVFDIPHLPYKVGMLDDGRESMLIAAQYLYKDSYHLNKQQIDAIEKLLLKQKPWVVMYTDMRADYLLTSQTAPVVITSNSEIIRATRQKPQIKFVVPKEGGFILIDTIAIPAATDKDEFVYAFLNYLFSPEILKKYADKFGFFPTSDRVPYTIPFAKDQTLEQLMKQLAFFSTDLPMRVTHEFWVSLKS